MVGSVKLVLNADDFKFGGFNLFVKLFETLFFRILLTKGSYNSCSGEVIVNMSVHVT